MGPSSHGLAGEDVGHKWVGWIKPIVRNGLTIQRRDWKGSKLVEAVSSGWPSILSNLKSLLEIGDTILKP